MEGFHEIKAGRFGDVEPVFEVKSPVGEFPVSLGSSGNPGFTILIIHGGESLSYDWVRRRG